MKSTVDWGIVGVYAAAAAMSVVFVVGLVTIVGWALEVVT